MKTPFISRMCVAAAAAALALGGGCKSGGPEEAIFKFLEALNGRDPEAPYRMLAKSTRLRLETASEDLRKKTNDAVVKKPHELVSWVGIGMKRDKRPVRLVKADNDLAVVKVALERGGEDEVTLKKEDGKWKIDLDATKTLAPAPAAAAPTAAAPPAKPAPSTTTTPGAPAPAK